MRRTSLTVVRMAISFVLLFAGCIGNSRSVTPGGNAAYFGQSQNLGNANVSPPKPDWAPTQPGSSPQPWTLRRADEPDYWDLTLEEAIHLAMHRSQVIRDLGGRVVEAPGLTATAFSPALAEADPQRGVEAALSAFDAQFATSLFWDHDERTFNNVFFGGGVADLIQNTRNFSLEFNKTSATGTQFFVRNLTSFTQNNSAVNRFKGAWDTAMEGEIRHPLLQGGGLEFNRIAGPGAQPGFYNGVLLARINTDVAAIDFEMAIRNLVRDVELTYWELHFAYRQLDAQRTGLEAARETWKVVQDKKQVGAEDDERAALVREQFFAAEAAVQESLAGNSLSLNNVGGVLGVERRLRWLLGLPPTGPRLIRPVDEPARVDVLFPWEEINTEAMWRRAELRRQQWELKRKELELVAARNFLKMRLDVVGQYRFRGFGDELFLGGGNNGSAFSDLLTGDLQGSRIGVELRTPVGNRIGHTAVRHALLEVKRQRELYQEQQLRIAHEVGQSYSQLDRSYALSRTYYNRSQAAIEQWQAISAKYDAGVQDDNSPEILLENVLAAQSRAVQATTAFHRALVDYNQAIMHLHFTKGTLLDYHQVYLTEGPHSPCAQYSARETASRLVNRRHASVQVPCPVNEGPYPQRHLEHGDRGTLGAPGAGPEWLHGNALPLSGRSDGAGVEAAEAGGQSEPSAGELLGPESGLERLPSDDSLRTAP